MVDQLSKHIFCEIYIRAKKALGYQKDFDKEGLEC